MHPSRCKRTPSRSVVVPPGIWISFDGLLRRALAEQKEAQGRPNKKTRNVLAQTGLERASHSSIPKDESELMDATCAFGIR
jgi:hypothetical protein